MNTIFFITLTWIFEAIYQNIIPEEGVSFVFWDYEEPGNKIIPLESSTAVQLTLLLQINYDIQYEYFQSFKTILKWYGNSAN